AAARGAGGGADRAAAVASLGPASERRDRARPPGRALRVLGRTRRAPPPNGRVRWGARRAVLRAGRSVAQPLGRLPLQRPHGAAPRAHVAVPAALLVRHPRGGGAAAASDRLGAPAGGGRHAAAPRRGTVHGSARPAAYPRAP